MTYPGEEHRGGDESLVAFGHELAGLDPASFSLDALAAVEWAELKAGCERVEELLRHYELLYNTPDPSGPGLWQSFHYDSTAVDRPRMLIARRSDGPMDGSVYHVLVNVEENDALTRQRYLGYAEFAVHPQRGDTAFRVRELVLPADTPLNKDTLADVALLAVRHDHVSVIRHQGSLVHPAPPDRSSAGSLMVGRRTLQTLEAVLSKHTHGVNYKPGFLGNLR